MWKQNVRLLSFHKGGWCFVLLLLAEYSRSLHLLTATRNSLFITCNSCNVQYVGHTTRRLRDRLYDHLHDIEKNHSTNFSRHWIDVHDKDVSCLTIQDFHIHLRGWQIQNTLRWKCSGYFTSILESRRGYILNGTYPVFMIKSTSSYSIWGFTFHLSVSSLIRDLFQLSGSLWPFIAHLSPLWKVFL